MPTALIAEDEPMLLAQLKTRLAEAWAELRIVAEAMNGEEALALAASHAPDIAFLDIRMPVKSGLEVARELGGRCHLVFVTAYDEYAVCRFRGRRRRLRAEATDRRSEWRKWLND
jgi:DNA-binding LytR/AlgR family response regulator